MAICTYVEYTKVAIDYWDIRPLVTISFIGYYLRNNQMNSHNQSYIGKCSLNNF